MIINSKIYVMIAYKQATFTQYKFLPSKFAFKAKFLHNNVDFDKHRVTSPKLMILDKNNQLQRPFAWVNKGAFALTIVKILRLQRRLQQATLSNFSQDRWRKITVANCFEREKKNFSWQVCITPPGGLIINANNKHVKLNDQHAVRQPSEVLRWASKLLLLHNNNNNDNNNETHSKITMVTTLLIEMPTPPSGCG